MRHFLLVFFLILSPKISEYCLAQSGIRISNQSAVKGIKIRKNEPTNPASDPLEISINNDYTKDNDTKTNENSTNVKASDSPTQTAQDRTPAGEVVKNDKPHKESEKKDADDDEKKDKKDDKKSNSPKNNTGKSSTTKSRAQLRAEQKLNYTTLESIECDYVKTKKTAKIEALKHTMIGLASDSRKEKPSFNPEKIRKHRDSIRILNQEINHLQIVEDSLDFLYEKDLLNYEPAFFLNFGPLRSRAFFDLIYGNNGTRFKALSNTGISLGTNTASLYSEIVSGNIGLFRVSMGTMISNSRADSTQKQHLQQQNEAYQRLVTYGGNTVLNIEYPILYLHSNNSQYNFIGRLITKGTADFPALGTNTTKWAGSGSVGLDFYGDAALNNDKLRFFFNANANGIMGTDQFIKNLGIANDKFVFGQLSVGLIFMQNYKISFIIHTLSTEAMLQNRAVIAGGQVLR